MMSGNIMWQRQSAGSAWQRAHYLADGIFYLTNDT